MSMDADPRSVLLPDASSDSAREDLLLKGIAGASVLLMVMLLALAYSNLSQYKQQNDALRSSHRIVQQVEKVYSILKDADAGCRGFLLTNDTAFLKPYMAARNELEVGVRELTTMLPDSEAIFTQYPLRIGVDRALRSMQQLVQDQRSGRTEVGRPDMRALRQSKAHMDDMRTMYSGIMGRYDIALRMREEKEETLGLVTPMSILLYALIALSGIAVLFFRMLRTLDRARLAESMARDAARQRDHEAQTREVAERSLKRVLDSSQSGIMAFRSVRDEQGTIVDFELTMANAAAGRVTGRDASDLIGQRLLDVMPSDDESGLFDLYVRVVETGEPLAAEFYYDRDGLVSWFENSAVRLLDGFVVTFSDVTERRNEQQLFQESQRLAVTGRFARMVAHEVRNPLTNIQLALDQLEADGEAASPEETQLYLGILKRNAERIGNLITQMLHTSRPLEMALEAGSINTVLRDALEQVKDRCELMSMECVSEFADDLSFVPMERGSLTIAFVNLCVNAIEAMESRKGVLRITSREADGKVRVSIQDNGKGLSEMEQEQIFQPFFSGRKGGMGLGLTEARNIFNAHNVLLTLESKVGDGTTFTLAFPVMG